MYGGGAKAGSAGRCGVPNGHGSMCCARCNNHGSKPTHALCSVPEDAHCEPVGGGHDGGGAPMSGVALADVVALAHAHALSMPKV